MPRNRQAPNAPTGQPYGDRQEQIQSQQAIPLPQGGRPSLPASGGGAPAPAPGGPPQDPMAAAVEYARNFDPGVTPLTAPSQRPGEPITTGLSLGPGAGPEIFSQPSRAMKSADVLDKLSNFNGNTRLSELAARIRGSGGLR